MLRSVVYASNFNVIDRWWLTFEPIILIFFFCFVLYFEAIQLHFIQCIRLMIRSEVQKYLKCFLIIVFRKLCENVTLKKSDDWNRILWNRNTKYEFSFIVAHCSKPDDLFIGVKFSFWFYSPLVIHIWSLYSDFI